MMMVVVVVVVVALLLLGTISPVAIYSLYLDDHIGKVVDRIMATLFIESTV